MKGGQKILNNLKQNLPFKNIWQEQYLRELERDKSRIKNTENQTTLIKNNSPITLLLISIGICLYFNLPIEGNAKTPKC